MSAGREVIGISYELPSFSALACANEFSKAAISATRLTETFRDDGKMAGGGWLALGSFKAGSAFLVQILFSSGFLKSDIVGLGKRSADLGDSAGSVR